MADDTETGAASSAAPTTEALARVAAAGGTEQALQHGYRLKQDADAGTLTVAAPDGRICLDIKITADGLKVSLDSAALSVQTSGAVSLQCGEFEVAAERDIRLRAGGSLISEAEQQHHSASVGNMTLDANDDVVLDGERVRLNSPDAVRQPDPSTMAQGMLPPRDKS